MGLFSFFRKKTAAPSPANDVAPADDEALASPPLPVAAPEPPPPVAPTPLAPTPAAPAPLSADSATPSEPVVAPSPAAPAPAPAWKRWLFGGGNEPAPAPVIEPGAPSPTPPMASSPASLAPLPKPPSPPATPAVIPELPAPVSSAAEPVSSEAAEREARRGWFDKLKLGLRKTGGSIARVFTGTKIDDALYEDLEAALLMADVGVKATEMLLDDLKRRVKDTKTTEPAAVRGLLADALADLLAPMQRSLEIGETVPTVIMVAGVNGAGKTTTIGKLTRHLAEADCKVLLAAADTFRAAAREQLAVWADRNKVEIVSQEGGDPSAVSFDAVKAGIARRCDVVIADTAGRLPTQLHLMDELKKLRRTLGKAMDSAPHEVLLVVDGNTGQNALTQVKAFDDALTLTGLVVTKLDGTAKGGVLAAIALWARERAAAGGRDPIPIYFIGVGEKLEDLQTFDAREFAQALLG